MARKVCVEVDNAAETSEKGHIGIDDISRKILKGYVGDDDKIARLFFDAESGEIVLPPTVGEASYSGSDLIYNSWASSGNNYLICKRFGDFIFVSSNNYTGASSAGQKLNGLYVVNMKTGTASQITSSSYSYMHAIELQENRYLISSSASSDIFYYNGDTETATIPSIGPGFNHKIDLGDKVLIRSQNSSVNLYLYDKASETFTSLGLPYHDIKETSQGIFAYCAYNTSTSYKRIYKFNSSSETFEEVLYTSGSVSADYKIRMHEDTYGTVWACAVAESATPHYYDGVYFNAGWDGTSTSPNFGYQNPPIFKLDGEDCFITNTKVWAFRGNKIEAILTTDGHTKYNSTVYFGASKGTRKYITHDIKSSTTATYGSKLIIWKNGTIEYNGLNTSTLGTPYNALEIQDKIFLSGGGTTYEVTENEENYGLVNVGSFNITKVYEFNGEIYATNSSTLYKYENGAFKSLVSASAGTSMEIVQAGSFICVIGYYNAYNTGSESAIKTYNLINGEVATLSTTVRYRLGETSYISTDSKTIYDVFGNSINSYTLSSINSVTDYLTRGGSATGYSNYNVFANVTDTNLSLLYEIPGEWEYKTVTWNIDDEVYETQIVKGGYLEEMEISKDGYEFLGWYKNGEKFDFTQPVNSNITLVAEWEELTWEEVDFIESNGTQYIDTGVPASIDLKVVADITPLSNLYPFGVAPSQNTQYYGFAFSSTNGAVQAYLGTTGTSGTYPKVENLWETGVRCTITANDNKKFYFNDTLVADYTSTNNTLEFSSTTITICTLNGAYLASRMSEKIHSFQMYNGDTLVRDYVPIRMSNGKYALLDKVNNQVYENKGTGTFTGGNIVTVTFDTDGGSTVESQQIVQGQTATKPSSPTKDGYYFDGWYSDDQKFDFSTPIETDITITAKWTTELKDLVLYDSGDENTAETGGWQARAWKEESADTATAPTLTKGTDQMTVYLTSSKTYRSGVAEVINDIDFSEYGTLVMTYSASTGTEAYGTTTAYLCVSNRSDTYSKTNRKALKEIVYTIWSGTQQQTVAETTVEIPLSSDIGVKDLFISIRTYNSPVTVNIKNITLKKY